MSRERAQRGVRPGIRPAWRDRALGALLVGMLAGAGPLGCTREPDVPPPTPPRAPQARTRAEGDPAVRALAWRNQAVALHRDKRFVECARLYAQARAATGRESALDAYNAACCHAQAGELKLALGRLEDAATLGWRDDAHLMRDPDLAPVRALPGFAAVRERVRSQEQRFIESVNPELRKLFDEDQADRAAPRADLAARDAARRARAAALLAEGAARTGDDHYHAAVLFLHGDTAADYRRAHELALRALDLSPAFDVARVLAVNAEDKALVAEGKPQRWGTQWRNGPDGTRTRYPVDPATTDAERARWGLPPLGPSAPAADAADADRRAASPPAPATGSRARPPP